MKATGKLLGVDSKTASNASNPPAEAPMPTIARGNGCSCRGALFASDLPVRFLVMVFEREDSAFFCLGIKYFSSMSATQEQNNITYKI
jgi:hypothetical protein